MYGTPDENHGEVVSANVVLAESSDIDEKVLKDYCRIRLSEYKIPRQINFVDHLEYTQNGKVLRK